MKFKDTAEAVKSLTKLSNGEVPKDLKKFLSKNIVAKEINEKLLCKLYLIKIKLNKIYLFNIGYEKEIAEAITESLEIKTTHGAEMLEVFRGIRSQLSNLISGIYLT
jgi:hypothetical protein